MQNGKENLYKYLYICMFYFLGNFNNFENNTWEF